jgi:NIMA (never in mitosis gene a)-related kinase
MEFAEGGDISMLIEQAKQRKKRIGESLIWNLLLHIADGLEYLHKNNIIHRDIKPANIFKSKDNVFKLGDLNVSKILLNGNFAKTKAGSPLYICP